MFDKFLARVILFPFTIIYGLVIRLRNAMYDTGIVRSSSFNVPVISVGNLTVGGAGKTPHIEYLIRLLKDHIYVATLSRGYKRKTKGFRMVDLNNNATQSGDEPLQFKRKFNNVTVAVAESRSFGIPLIMQRAPQTQVILLDDAFQHRSVKPGLNILLTEYDLPYTKDLLIPAGRLREHVSSAIRADIVIVSKCPAEISISDRVEFEAALKLEPTQKLFFSYYHYMTPYFIFDKDVKKPLARDVKVVVLAAIAKMDYMLSYLDQNAEVINTVKFEDHHYFSEQEMGRLSLMMDEYKEEEIIIVTTEKDAIRLELHKDYILEQALAIFVLPIEVKFHFSGSDDFDRYTKDYLLNFTI